MVPELPDLPELTDLPTEPDAIPPGLLERFAAHISDEPDSGLPSPNKPGPNKSGQDIFGSGKSGLGKSGPTAAYRTITLEGVRLLAEAMGVPSARAMSLCLGQEIWPLRFARNRGAFTSDGQRALLDSTVAVVGCGGLGGHVATLLARAGIGSLILCDGDTFSESNLNRQLLCRESGLGRNKAEVAAAEVSSIASHVSVKTCPVNITPENAVGILSGADLIMDCLDSVQARLLVGDVARNLNIPVVYAAIAGDEGFVSLVRPGEDTLRAVYGADAAPGTKQAEAVTGVPTVTPAATAALQTALALNYLSGRDLPPSTLYHLDLLAPFLEAFSM